MKRRLVGNVPIKMKEDMMRIREAIEKRKSIRAYKSDPVPKEVLKEILKIATRAPSGVNTQPWEIAVLTSKVLDQLRNENVDAFQSAETFGSDFGEVKPFSGIYKERQRALAVDLYNILGIAKEDEQKRMEWWIHGLRSFGAPALLVLYVDESLDPRMACSDLGGFAQTICLAAMEYGLGTCINAQSIMYPEVVRKVTGIPESKKMHTSIAIGYPEWNHPANKMESKRESVDNITTWHGFE